jgi:hypothetical protein
MIYDDEKAIPPNCFYAVPSTPLATEGGPPGPPVIPPTPGFFPACIAKLMP